MVVATPMGRADVTEPVPVPASPVADRSLELRPGTRQTRSLAPGSSARYSLSSEPGEVLLVEIDQGGLDIRVVYQSPDGESVTIDSLLQRDEREILLIEGNAPGLHLITLRSEEFSERIAQPSLSASVLDPVRAASDIDAYRSMMIGTALAHQTDESAVAQALADFGNAAAIWRASGDRRNEAWALYNVAALNYWSRNDWRAAASAAEQAAAVYRADGDERLYASARNMQAAALLEAATKSGRGKPGQDAAGLFAQADSLLNEALAIHQQSGRDFDRAIVLINLGLGAFYQSRWDLARNYWSDAAGTFRKLGEPEQEAMALANKGVISFETGQLRDAVTTYSQVLEALPTADPTELRAATLDNRAQVYFDLAEYDKALTDFGKALTMHRRLGAAKGQGRSLSGIANVYYALGDLDKARENFDRALDYRIRAGDGRGQVSTSRDFGDVERQLGNLERAEELHRMSFNLSQNPKQRAKANVALGRDLQAAQRGGESIAPLDEAIRIARKPALERVLASALLERGNGWIAVGDLERAGRDLDEALALYQRLGLADGQASAFYALATVAATEGHWRTAVDLTRQSIAHIEAVRGRVPFPELRATYVSQRRAPYELYIDLMMRGADNALDNLRDDFVAQALAVAERARARALVDLVNEAALDVELGSDPVLLERRRVLYQRLSEARYRLDRTLDSGDAGRGDTESRIRDELNLIETDIQLVDAELRRTNDRYAAMTDPQPLAIAEMRALLEIDELLIQFSLGEARSFVWLVDRDSIRSRTLPGRKTIEDLARSVYEQLSVYLPDRRSRRERDVELEVLTDLLFDEDTDLSPYQRLLVAADGVLQYVPFAVLPVPQPRGGRSALVTSHEIVGVPSMSALALNRRVSAVNPEPSRLVAIFADPVFASNDPRLDLAGVPATTTPVGPASDMQQTPPVFMARLPYTLLEAKGIADLEPGTDSISLATGLDVNRSAIMDAELGDYRFVHFATHGRIDTRYPALSALVLSRIDSAGRTTAGLLQLRDISQLTLNAELVTLSACDTALGREIRGESLLGLAQGFFSAGADQVLASLWSVPDRGTATLMEELYRGLLQGGLSPAAALRRAQLTVAEQRRWADPYYWGSFILQRGR